MCPQCFLKVVSQNLEVKLQKIMSSYFQEGSLSLPVVYETCVCFDSDKGLVELSQRNHEFQFRLFFPDAVASKKIVRATLGHLNRFKFWEVFFIRKNPLSFGIYHKFPCEIESFEKYRAFRGKQTCGWNLKHLLLLFFRTYEKSEVWQRPSVNEVKVRASVIRF